VLESLVKSTNWCAIGRKYGVSDNAVRKWAREYCII
jgi:transposase-like protein